MNDMRTITLSIFALFGSAGSFPAAEVPFRIEQQVILTSTGDYHWSQSRAAVIPGNPSRVILTTQEYERGITHGYRDLFMTESSAGAQSWSVPQRIDNLRRTRMPEGHDFVMGDVCPQWHAASRKVLATGKTFGFRDGTKEDRGLERVSYAVFDLAGNQWSGLKIMAMPEQDHEGRVILEPNAGCNLRFDLPNGDILLPVRYRKDPKSRAYTTVVARCKFDGETLTYLEHGSELTLPRDRGLYEPSVTGFRGNFYLTLRADHSAFVARSQDGLNYEPVLEWKFDDGEVLGSYNTQQHWIAHSDALYLIYTRRGANNDHVFRHRAPIFIAEVDLKRLRVLRATERVLLPEKGLDLGGGFASVDVSEEETWVISTEMGFPKERLAEPNHVLLSRIIWNQPNRLVSTSVP